MIERAALGRVRRRIDEAAAERDGLRQVAADYRRLVQKIDALLPDAAVADGGSGHVASLAEEPERAMDLTDMSGLRRSYQVLLHPDLLSTHDSPDAESLSVRLNSAIDSGDALAAADVLAELSDDLDSRSDLAAMVLKMFAVEDEVALLQSFVRVRDESPLRDIRDAIRDDPDLDLAAFFRSD